MAAADWVKGSLVEMGTGGNWGDGPIACRLTGCAGYSSAVTANYSPPGLLASSLPLSSPLTGGMSFPVSSQVACSFTF